MAVLKNIAIGLDQTVNCAIKLADGWGMPDELLSARAWRLRRTHTMLYRVIDGVFFWDANHCQECYQIELDRQQLPKGYQS